MKEVEVVGKIHDRLGNLLKDIPFLQVKRVVTGNSSTNFRPDLVFETTTGTGRRKILVEVKSIGEPRYVRYAIQQLKEYLTQFEDAYGVVAAPYISSDTAGICRENNVGYIDLAGNCLLRFDQVNIERQNFPSVNLEKRTIRSIFTPKSSRILRVMLCNPKRSWQLQELANEAKVSLGLAFKVKKRLFDLEYAREENKNICLNRPGDLLDKWTENYSFRKNRMSDYFSTVEPSSSGWVWGVGGAFLFPTASADVLGTGKWAVGPTAIALKQTGPWTIGGLTNHIWSYAGDSDRNYVNSTFIQPFLTYVTPTKTTLAINSESTFDWRSTSWNIPINLMVSQMIKVGGQPLQLQVGARYWANSPQEDQTNTWGFRTSIIFLFPK